MLNKGNGNPLQYSCLENPRDRGAWWAAVCGVAQSDTTDVTSQQQQQGCVCVCVPRQKARDTRVSRRPPTKTSDRRFNQLSHGAGDGLFASRYRSAVHEGALNEK